MKDKLINDIGKVFSVDINARIQWEIITTALENYGLEIIEGETVITLPDEKIIPIDMSTAEQWDTLIEKLGIKNLGIGEL